MVRFELAILSELGFGLDLSACAATGGNDALVYVSPRTVGAHLYSLFPRLGITSRAALRDALTAMGHAPAPPR